MTSKYSGYLSDHGGTASRYKRDFSSPLTQRKSELSSINRSSPHSSSSKLCDSKPPLFGSSYGPSRLSHGSSNYSTVPNRSTVGTSSSNYSPSVSHRTFSKSSAFNRSISNDFGVSYTSKPQTSCRSSGFSSSDHSRSSATNLTPFESRYSSGASRMTSSESSKPTYLSSYVDTDYKTSKDNWENESKFRILVSRAASPDVSSSSVISDTQTEKYPLTDTTRRRQLKNAFTQTEEKCDPRFTTPLSKLPIADQILPKQSGFVPKNRNFRYQSKSDIEDEPPSFVPNTARTEKPSENMADDLIPRQSSFLKKIRHDDATERAKEAPRPIIGTTVSLKDSIEKVKTWKKLMRENSEYKDDDDDFEWRKKMHFGSNNSSEHKDPVEVQAPSEAAENEATDPNRKLNSNQQDNREGISGFLHKASSHVSLPDIVESAERSKERSEETNKTFIGRLKDIDSLLDFEDSAGEVQDDKETQVSSWVDDDIERSEDIDDLLDGDLCSTSGQQSQGAKSKRSNLISNNPFVRKSNSAVPDDEDSFEDDCTADRGNCQQLVSELLGELEVSQQLSVDRLVERCQLNERSRPYRKLQNKLKAEQKFTGFETIQEMLEYLKVNVNQLENCAVLLYQEWKAKYVDGATNARKKLNCLHLQCSLDNDDDEVNEVNTGLNESVIKLAVKIHSLIDFLIKGKELRKILFSLKTIFKNQPECVKEFIYSEGLTSLIKIAEDNSSNSTYQCYILRVIGQLMLNIDGMNGIVSVNKVVQWLYNLTSSSSPLVSRTALRLLIVFISHSECNSFLFIQAVSSVSLSKGKKTFSNLMDIMKKNNTSANISSKDDPCFLILVLFNKTLESVPDQDSFYDVVDSLAEQGLDKIFWTKTSYGSAPPEFVEQMKNFENMIKQEDIRQLQQKQPPSPSDSSKERKRIQSRTANRRSVYYLKRDDILQKEINRTNAIKQANQQKLIKDFEGNKISNAETDRNLNDFKKDLAEGTFTGIVGRARDGLITSQNSSTKSMDEPEESTPVMKSEGRLRWEETEARAIERLKRNDLELVVKEMDFTDVTEVDEINFLDVKVQTLNDPRTSEGQHKFGFHSTIPRPPFPTGGALPPPLPSPGTPPTLPPPPPIGNSSEKKEPSKTLRLHWKEARAEFPLPSGRMGDTIWSRMAKEIGPVKINKGEFGMLFHNKTTDIKIKSDVHKKEQTLLDAKRSNMINIALTALPQLSLIKTAILNMDQSILTKEAVEKLLTLLPSEEEKAKLIEAQLALPDIPLGQAEQFLLTISIISEVRSRLKLWLFMLEFDFVEGEIGDALADLKQAMEQVKSCSTLKYALSVLLAVGNCLNSSQARGFTLDFLSKVPDVKDSVKKKSLLHHLVSFVIQFYSDASDIFSEIDAVTRCSRVDWDELKEKLSKLEEGCKASWDDIRAIVKHDNNVSLKNKLSSVLADFAERTLMLKIVHRRLSNRFKRFLLYFGYHPSDICMGSDVKVNLVFKIISSFALEWRATRTKILHTRKKKEAERERKLAASSPLSLSRSTHGSFSADESTYRNVTSKPPLFPTLLNSSSATNNGNSIKPSALLSPAPKVSKWPSTSSIGYASETESAYETGDEELFGAVLRSATASPSQQRRQSRESWRRLSTDKNSSWRSSSRDRNGY